MPEDKSRNGKGNPEDESRDDVFDFGSEDSSAGDSAFGGSSDSGLGNLPPLSDFESSDTLSDSNLPPLSTISSDSGKGSEGGLPPLSDISVETPMPTGGNIKPPPPGYGPDDSAFHTPASESGLDTPQPGSKTGFQDLAGDSDFSPETPEVGPGPESDMETPMFDSAFGITESDFSTPTETPAPTQAMRTPMFGIDEGAEAFGVPEEPPVFGRPAAAQAAAPFEAGTPVPDFSPDTGIPFAQETPAGQPPAKKRKVKAGKAPARILVSVIAAILCLIVGIVAGPFVSEKVKVLPNPARDTLAQLQTDMSKLQAQLRERDTQLKQYQDAITKTGEGVISEEEFQKRVAEYKRIGDELTTLTSTVEEKKNNLKDIQSDIDIATEDYVKTKEMLDNVQKDVAIMEAREEGLLAENDRLVALNGDLTEANERRIATKAALESAIDQLYIQVSEGIPLTPQKYAYSQRTEAVENLRKETAHAKWVTPDILNQYTNLYLDELAIAATTEHFYARIPINHSFGGNESMWAECLMNGNSSVYFMTIDGKYAGIFQNVSDTSLPRYEFRQFLPKAVDEQIRKSIEAARPKDFAKELEAVKARQEARNDQTPLQKMFESL